MSTDATHDIIIIGAGVGGLCAAIRLRSAGHRVTVIERRHTVGGKLNTYERDGFRFDTGPSLLTLPGWFDEVFALAGTRLRDEVDLVELDPAYRYTWTDGSTLVLPAGRDAAVEAVEAFSPGEGRAFAAFADRAATIWSVAERTFFAGPMTNPLDLARRMKRPGDLVAIDAISTLASRARHTFRDPRLRQWAGRYATYSGSSPFRAPATLGCIPHLELALGCWHITGGLGSLATALALVAESVGVDIVTNHDVSRVEVSDDAVRSVVCADGTRHSADVVIANVDAEHLYADLLPSPKQLTRVRRATPSGSGYVVLAGVAGATEDLCHHNLWFSRSYEQEYGDLHAGRPAAEPTLYACVSSRTDPAAAPVGHENWFVLVNAPADGGAMPGYDTTIALALRDRVGLTDERILFTETISPADIAERYRATHGSIYGTSSDGRRAAFLRPANRGPCRGLYLVGGSSHPGGGLPLVAASARIVADLVRDDLT